VGVRVVGDALVLEIMRFVNELVDVEDLSFPSDNGVRPQELHMAEQLVKSLATSFDPSKYTDDYRANLMKIIQAKMRGKKLPAVKASSAARDDKVIDLMSRLKASLRDTKTAGERSRRGKRAVQPARTAGSARKSA
jgi:DNA end-binding protein Ku